MKCDSCKHDGACHEVRKTGMFGLGEKRLRCNALVEFNRRWPDTGSYQERCKCDQSPTMTVFKMDGHVA